MPEIVAMTTAYLDGWREERFPEIQTNTFEFATRSQAVAGLNPHWSASGDLAAANGPAKAQKNTTPLLGIWRLDPTLWSGNRHLRTATLFLTAIVWRYNLAVDDRPDHLALQDRREDRRGGG